MPFPDDPDDDAGFIPPLPQEDRLWRHPSEMAGLRAAPHRSHRPQRSPRSGLLALFLIGAVTATLSIAVIGTLFNDDQRGETEFAVGPAAGDLPPETLSLVSQAVVKITVDGPSASEVVTGLLIRPDGYVVTAADPLQRARSLTVTLSDGRAFNATVVGTDVPDDLAVIDIEGSGLPTARLGDLSTVKEGDTVFVVGRTQRDRRSWVAAATFQATGMRLTTTNGSALHDMIGSRLNFTPPTDSPVLCTATGEVIGMITSRSTNTSQKTVLLSAPTSLPLPGTVTTFAHPMTWTNRVADDLITHGEVHFAWLGILSSDAAPSGALIASVVPDGPAERAGLRANDVIVSINDQAISSSSELFVRLRLLSVDESVEVTALRGDQRLTVTATLSDRT